MALDDQEKRKDLERQKLLEEIRRRAEEAELKRIEKEEQKADHITKPLLPPDPPRPVHPDPPPPTPAKPVSVSRDEQTLNDLSNRFFAAIDGRKIDKAAELLEELGPLLKDPAEVEGLRERLQKARKQQQENAKAKKRQAEQQAKELAAQERARRESNQKKIADLLQKANNFYQREKYDRGTELLDELLAIDPENDEAKDLAANISKAKELAERIQEEEARRRASEAATAVPATPLPTPSIQTPAEVWGSKEIVRPESELGLPPVSDGPAPPPKPPVVERIIERVSKVHIPLRPVLIGIGVVLVVVSAYYIITSLKQAVFPPKYSLLVLPATPQNADSSSQFLAEAVTEELISIVSTVSDLRVVAPATTFSLRTYTGDLSRAARNLGARYFLAWSVARVDDRVTFQVTLFDTSSSGPVWSKQIQNSVRELQSTTREVGRAIMSAMQVATESQEEEIFTRVSNTSPEAFDAYARGRWYLRQNDPQFINTAISSFALALDRDSLFSEADLGLASAHLTAIEREVDTVGTRVQMAWRYLTQALALGARSPESYRIRGLIAQYRLEYDRAVEELERGAAFAPSDAETQRRLAFVYTIKGRVDDALRVAAKAVADDPRNAESYTTMGLIQHLRDENLRSQGESNRNEYVDALKSFEQGMLYARDRSGYASSEYADLLEYAHRPERAAQILVDRVAQTQHYVDYYKLGRIYQTAGRPKPQWEATLQRAKALLETAVATNPLDAVAYSYLALTETRLGAFKNALEASARARQIAPGNLDVLYNTARMYALQTDRDQALEHLGKALNVRYRLSSILDMDFYNLRPDPEFQHTITR
ncbi:MAG TPA: hypothetical protein DGH68_12230 [Bacteroidetes bacterium]|nr:hypothetical protein [Bacteroidota bacterium]